MEPENESVTKPIGRKPTGVLYVHPKFHESLKTRAERDGRTIRAVLEDLIRDAFDRAPGPPEEKAVKPAPSWAELAARFARLEVRMTAVEKACGRENPFKAVTPAAEEKSTTPAEDFADEPPDPDATIDEIGDRR